METNETVKTAEEDAGEELFSSPEDKVSRKGGGQKPADPNKVTWKKDWKNNKVIYFMMLPILVLFIIFHYLPMFGIVMAFQDFSIAKGFFGSPFVGWDNFVELFTGGDEFLSALKNTVIIGCFNLVLQFPAPIVFAFIITNIRFKGYRKVVQTMSYLPNFVAAVVVTTLVIEFCGRDGAITKILTLFGMEQQNLLSNANPPVFWLIYAFMGVWQSFGYGSIMYVASLSNISGDYYEAAAIDGANRFQCVFRISLPCIMPLVIMMLTINVGTMFMAGFNNILLLYNADIYDVADTLFTYTYRMAFGSFVDYSLSAASGLFQSCVGTIMLFGSNWLSKKAGQQTLF